MRVTMKKLDVRPVKIKSFVIDSSYDCIVNDKDEELGYGLLPVDGFALVEEGSFINGDYGETFEDNVFPFFFDDIGTSLCQSFHNYIGIVKRGDAIPAWILEEVERRNSK